jgi:deazaflavin-dependent oxidoreductase (nitroreductase family)
LRNGHQRCHGHGCHRETRMSRRKSSLKWRLIRFGPRLLYRIGLGPFIGRMVLLLTTTGRKSGRPHQVPLQYEAINGSIYVAAALGKKADWFRNILAKPEVTVQLKARRFCGKATPIIDPAEIADFLQLRLDRHPKIVAAIMHRAGLPRHPTRQDLEVYAMNRALVAIVPVEGVPANGFGKRIGGK